MENQDEFYQFQLHFMEIISDSETPITICIEAKFNDVTQITNEFRVICGAQLIDEILSFKLEQSQIMKLENRLELFLICENEIVGKSCCNFADFIQNNQKEIIDNHQVSEMEIIFSGKFTFQTKLRLSVKSIDWLEGFSARSTIYPNNVSDTQNQIVSNLKQEVENWKQKYENIEKEIDSLSKELEDLKVRDKGSQHEIHSNTLSHLRRVIKYKLLNFIQIYENQQEQIDLFKKELNLFRRKICSQCSDSFYKNSVIKQIEKVKDLNLIIEKKNLEILSLQKLIDEQKLEIIKLKENQIYQNKQQNTLRMNLINFKKENIKLFEESKRHQYEIQQNSTEINLLQKENQQKQRLLFEQQEKYKETIDLYKQWSLSIIQAIEIESQEKYDIIESLIQIKNQLSMLHNSTIEEEVQICECKIQKHIQKYKNQIQQLENLLSQYQTRLESNQQQVSLHKRQSSRESSNISQDNSESFINLPLILDYSQYDQLKNQIEQKEIEITKLKQKIGDIINFALELGNSVLIEQIQLTIL